MKHRETPYFFFVFVAANELIQLTYISLVYGKVVYPVLLFQAPPHSPTASLVLLSSFLSIALIILAFIGKVRAIVNLYWLRLGFASALVSFMFIARRVCILCLRFHLLLFTGSSIVLITLALFRRGHLIHAE